jgi:hypothetical protein
MGNFVSELQARLKVRAQEIDTKICRDRDSNYHALKYSVDGRMLLSIT